MQRVIKQHNQCGCSITRGCKYKRRAKSKVFGAHCLLQRGISSMDHNYPVCAAAKCSSTCRRVLLIHCYGVECTHPIPSSTHSIWQLCTLTCFELLRVKSPAASRALLQLNRSICDEKMGVASYVIVQHPVAQLVPLGTLSCQLVICQ
jgi:hypothetical protein